MNRNEITLQEMFSSVIGELREGGRWGTAHIYQSAVNAFSVFTKWQPMPMRKLSPTVLKRFENFLRQRNCSWNTVSTYIKTVRSVYHRAVDRKYIRYVPRLFEHVYTGTRADRKKALEASDISSLVRETERSLQGGTLPNAQQKQGFSSYSCSCSGAYLSWIWHTCTKGTCREIYYRTDDGRRDGR